jgi:phosphoglucosamine mutase
MQELGGAARIVCGRDTRESGIWIERYLADGIRRAGGELVSAGVIPTPGVALVTRQHNFAGGVVISASHNPFPDNGIKILRSTGEKVTRQFESRIETRLGKLAGTPVVEEPADVEKLDVLNTYVEHLFRVAGGTDLSGMRVAIDCAHGAMSEVAPLVLKKLGLAMIELNAKPDGKNINANSGSTHPESLQKRVVEAGCHVGFAFDGDGDRVILVDQFGRLVDGDGVLFLVARHLKAAGRLVGDSIVATVMSNLGLEVALSKSGIKLHRCPVGDLHVHEAMLDHRSCLGGEQSGHIIFSDLLPTGDGLGTAVSVLRILAESGQMLDELLADLSILPQVLINVSVSRKPELSEVPELLETIRSVEKSLNGRGRVLVRYSGTESIFRIMLEGPEQDMIERMAGNIADSARLNLG